MKRHKGKLQVLTLAEIKSHSRIETGGEDARLTDYGRSAEEAVSRAINMSWYDVEALYGHIPTPLYHACLMLVDHFYNNRGASASVNMGTLPLGVASLIKPYVRLV
ncbi:MAG: head-tail connector protein [Bacteroidales bacterium]|nr:head-tail connector protein [Bacteroidales bacterium]